MIASSLVSITEVVDTNSHKVSDSALAMGLLAYVHMRKLGSGLKVQHIEPCTRLLTHQKVMYASPHASTQHHSYTQ